MIVLEYIMITSIIDKKAGFFSLLFFSLNHYIYSFKNKIGFNLDSHSWLFSYKIGWEDYFVLPCIKVEDDVEYCDDSQDSILPLEETRTVGFFDVIVEYPISEYKKFIPKYYRYNEKTKEVIKNTKVALALDNKKYGSIFIRRGDKLFHESKLINAELYLEMLLSKFPECNIVYLQTDDYTAYEEMNNYIMTHSLDIKLLTLCPKTSRGALTSPPNFIVYIHENADYINSVKDTLQKTLSVHCMNPEQKYQHTIDMIVGIDIVLHSEYCILDYQSNVSRFIKLAHKNYDHVFDVTGVDVDLNKQICPAYSF